LSKIPLPKEYEEYRKDIEKWRDTFRGRFKEYREDIENVRWDAFILKMVNLSMFLNASFYVYNETKGISEFDLPQLEKEFESMQLRMRKLVSATGKCFSKLA
jgi:hypothetical protein